MKSENIEINLLTYKTLVKIILKSILLGILLISFNISVIASKSANQNENRFYNTPSYTGKFFVVLSDDSNFEAIEKNVINFTETNLNHSFYLINSSGRNINQLKNEINEILNSDYKIQEQYMYLVICGEENTINRLQSVHSEIFTRTLILYNSGHFSSEGKIIADEFTGENSSFISSISSIDKFYKWHIEINNLKSTRLKELNSSTRGTTIGLNLGTFVNQRNSYESYVPENFLTYGLHIIRPFGKSFQLKFGSSLGLKLPDRDKIQDEVMGQIDFDPSTILSGGGVNEEIDLNIDLKGHIYYNFNLELQYFPINVGKFSPYIGYGLQYQNLTAFNEKIDTTLNIEINSSNMSGGGFGDFANESGLNFRDNATQIQGVNMFLSSGFFYQLTERTSVSLNSKYGFSPNSLTESADFLNNFNFDFGININLKTKKYYIDYFD